MDARDQDRMAAEIALKRRRAVDQQIRASWLLGCVLGVGLSLAALGASNALCWWHGRRQETNKEAPSHVTQTQRHRGKTARVLPVPAPKPSPANWKPVTFSVYAERYHGRRTASGERYDHRRGFTAASNLYPLGTVLAVRRRQNGSPLQGRVTDRLDRALGRTRIDLSGAAMRALAPSYDLTDRTATIVRGEFKEIR